MILINTIVSIKPDTNYGIVITTLDGQYSTEWFSFNAANTAIIGSFDKLPV